MSAPLTNSNFASSSDDATSSSTPLESPERVAEARLVTLQRELDASRREGKASLALRDAIIRQTEAALAQERTQRTLLRQRVMNAYKMQESALDEVREDLAADEQVWQQELFHALGVNAKLMHMTATGQPCNIDLASMWEQAFADKIHWKTFRAWIQDRIDESVYGKEALLRMKQKRSASPVQREPSPSSSHMLNSLYICAAFDFKA